MSMPLSLVGVSRIGARILALAMVATCALAAVRGPAPARAAASDISVVSTQHLDARLTQYTLRTPALKSTTPVRILLPAGYASNPTQRYPVLYLLHGCCNYDVSGAASWTVHGNVETATANLPVIVVMPDDGQGGFYTNWYNNGAGGDPQWETYDIDQLIPWVDQNFRTIATRDGRAITGLSMGGFGAMSLAARHPDLFVFAASFSGVVDNHDPTGAFQAVDEALGLQDGGLPGSIWGPYSTQAIRWEGSNPVDLANNLRGLVLQVRTGNGLPGGPFGGNPDPIEVIAHTESTAFNAKLNQLGIPHVWDDYGPGTHSWPYWNRDLTESLPTIMATFAHPPPAPAQVTFTAIEPGYEAYGWQVALDRPVLEFSTLSAASRTGFTLSGSGTAVVTTPADYTPGQPATVDVRTQSGSSVLHLTASRSGELAVPLTLGPANPQQALTTGAVTTVYRTTVTIAPSAPAKRARSRRSASRSGRRQRRRRSSRQRA